jgi:hypothetical protein
VLVYKRTYTRELGVYGLRNLKAAVPNTACSLTEPFVIGIFNDICIPQLVEQLNKNYWTGFMVLLPYVLEGRWRYPTFKRNLGAHCPGELQESS